MKTTLAFAGVALVITCWAALPSGLAQGTAFTYQGRLADQGTPAEGRFDLRFTLYDSLAAGTQVGTVLEHDNVSMSNGLFTVTLDFGPAAFTGPARWLETAVRPGDSVGTYSLLSPRQPLMPTPYAIYAANASTAASAAITPWSGLTGMPPGFADSADNDTTYSAGAGLSLAGSSFSLDTGFTDARYWRLTGNAGTTTATSFLGTTDNQPLEIRVNQNRALRLEPTAFGPNVIVGSSANRVTADVTSATIAGGGELGRGNRVTDSFGTVAGGSGNEAGDDAGSVTDAGSATVGGGYGNRASGSVSTVAGGAANQATGPWSTVSGGLRNLASGHSSVAVGGYQNAATNLYSTIGGGYSNRVDGAVATVAGGSQNLASGGFSTVSGGRENAATGAFAVVPGGMDNEAGGWYSLATGLHAKALHDGAFVWADSTVADFGSTAANQFLIRAGGGVGIGKNNPASALDVAGTVKAIAFEGSGASVTSLNADNLMSGTVPDSRIAATVARDTEIFPAVLAGDGPGSGLDADRLDGLNATDFWKLGGNAGTTAGTHFLGTTDNEPLEFKVNGLRALRLEPNVNGAPNVIAGSPRNFVGASVVGATIAGGGATNYAGFAFTNSVLANFGVVGGGRENGIGTYSHGSAIGGGEANEIEGNAPGATIAGGVVNGIGTNSASSAIGGGYGNDIGADSPYAALAGGWFNDIGTNSGYTTIGGGDDNDIGANSPYATIAGGRANDIGASATNSSIGGGFNNRISANSAFATIPGGVNCSVIGDYGFAAGRRAAVRNDGTFVWADSQNADFASTGPNQFLIRAAGGVGIGTTNPITQLTIAGSGPFNATTAAAVVLDNTSVNGHRWEWHALDNGRMQFADGSATRITVDTNGNVGIGVTNPTNRLHVAGGVSATAFVTTSDRNAKENFAPVSPREVLDKITALPITTWTFKELPDGRHMGPTAQDFYAAFNLGSSDRTITTVDADGVALAAVQGLNQKLEERLKAKDTEIQELKQRMEKLERWWQAQQGAAQRQPVLDDAENCE